jgi:hypothetical protein
MGKAGVEELEVREKLLHLPLDEVPHLPKSFVGQFPLDPWPAARQILLSSPVRASRSALPRVSALPIVVIRSPASYRMSGLFLERELP